MLIRRRIAVLVAVLWALALATGAGAHGWTVQPTPNPAGAIAGRLNGVSCPTRNACLAVGTFSLDGRVYLPLAERLGPSGWRLAAAPVGQAQSSVQGVACVTLRACIAVGFTAAGRTLAERWNGVRWKRQATPNPGDATFSSLVGVSCVNARACTAVGQYITASGSALTLAERWNGSRWKIQRTLRPRGAISASLRAVSCAKVRDCIAVGDYSTDGESSVTLAEHWDGASWKRDPTPTPQGAVYASLVGVSCPTRRGCTGVGNTITGPGPSAPTPSLAERWDGLSWKIQATPNPAPRSSLTSVSCPARRVCTAVGAYTSTVFGANLSLAERWNGSHWQLQSTPGLGGAPNGMRSVSCPATDFCIAVGVNGAGALAERWTR